MKKFITFIVCCVGITAYSMEAVKEKIATDRMNTDFVELIFCHDEKVSLADLLATIKDECGDTHTIYSLSQEDVQKRGKLPGTTLVLPVYTCTAEQAPHLLKNDGLAVVVLYLKEKDEKITWTLRDYITPNCAVVEVLENHLSNKELSLLNAISVETFFRRLKKAIAARYGREFITFNENVNSSSKQSRFTSLLFVIDDELNYLTNFVQRMQTQGYNVQARTLEYDNKNYTYAAGQLIIPVLTKLTKNGYPLFGLHSSTAPLQILLDKFQKWGRLLNWNTQVIQNMQGKHEWHINNTDACIEQLLKAIKDIYGHPLEKIQTELSKSGTTQENKKQEKPLSTDDLETEELSDKKDDECAVM